MQEKETVNAADNASDESGRGFWKAWRHPDALELLATNPLAIALAYVIAARANWRSGFNRHGLGPGEAMLGDFENYGMSQKQYRTAKKILEKGGFASFKGRTNGTIAKLLDKRIFSVLEDSKGEQGANKGRADGERGATNEERLTEKNDNNERRLNDANGSSVAQQSAPSSVSHRPKAFNEEALMDRLRTLLGDDEMARVGGNWRKNWVRKHPALVESGLNDLNSEIKEGREKANRAAWLVDLLKRWKSAADSSRGA